MSERAIAAAASIEAYRARTCINLHMPDDAADIIRGRLAANLLALCDLEGTAAAMSYLTKLATKHFVPPEEKVIRLIASKSSECGE